MNKLTLLRHGQSEWNASNKFCGWTDVDLTERGIKEAHTAGKLLTENGYLFDEVHTNLLKRAIKTTWLVLEEMDLMWLPVSKTWRLNERHYGALQGLNKNETAQKYGEEQVKEWRRGFSTRPPELTSDDPRFPAHDPRYQQIEDSELPRSESLQDCMMRTLPYWIDVIGPQVMDGRRVLVSASGNSLRAIVKHLEDLPDEAIEQVNIPYAIPLVYELDDELNVQKKYYLGDPDQVNAVIDEIKDQGHLNTR